MDYSSPLRVKVVKEVSKQRREEVDLDTGKRRSWVETTEYEVLDLCGETEEGEGEDDSVFTSGL